MLAPKKNRVLLIGWDAADWKVINPLLAGGKLPNLERLISQGVTGNLATLYPSLSPLLWTSIATGKRPFKHGILGFTEPNLQGEGIRPVSSSSRRTRAIWNMLQLAGLRSNVVGWWPSHPVEPINGVMVSNHYHRAFASIDKPWPMQPGTIHPRRLAKNLADLRVHPQELTSDVIALFVPEFSLIDQKDDHRLEGLARIIADCATVHAAATALIQLEPWDFMAVYYDAIDHFSHGFMRFHPPRLSWVSEEDFRLFNGVVEAAYRFHDMMLGVLLELAGEETTVVLISDHGFYSDHLRPKLVPDEPAGPAAEHRQHGVLVIKGPGIKKGEMIHGASLLDITPTILQLFDLPTGEDMDGLPLTNALLAPPEVAFIPSWDELPGQDGSHSAGTQIDPVANHEAIRQLVALGYIERPDDDSEKALRATIRELDYSLARSYMDANRFLDALPILEKLSKEWPDENRFAVHLLITLQSLGRIAGAGKTLEKLLTRSAALTGEEQKATEEYLLAGQRLAEGKAESSLIHLQRAEEINPEGAEIQLRKGEAYLQLNQYEKAMECFHPILVLDPENSATHLGLCRACLGKRRNRAALEEALNAVELQYLNPNGHFLLGVALQRIGRQLKAVEAFRVALQQNPNHLPTLDRLVHIIGKRLKDPITTAYYLKKMDEAKERIAAIQSGKIAGADAAQSKPLVAPELKILALDPELPERVITPLSDTITIVSGLPRSGTSMMMQILAAGGLTPLMDGKRPADGHNEKGYFEDYRARSLRRDAGWLYEANGKAVKIVAQLLPALPADKGLNYCVIFMVRELDEVLASQKEMLADQGIMGAGMPDLLLKQTFITQLERVQRLLARRRIPTLYVGYRECICNPAEIADQINAFLGGGLDGKGMAEAVAPRLYFHRGEEF